MFWSRVFGGIILDSLEGKFGIRENWLLSEWVILIDHSKAVLMAKSSEVKTEDNGFILNRTFLRSGM